MTTGPHDSQTDPAAAQAADRPPAEQPADRLCIHPGKPFHDADQLARGVGVRFRGNERTDVEEYCISEGWIRVALPRKMDRHGNPLTIKLSGPVEVWFHDTVPSA